jgi:hypothetical protein
MIKTRPRTYFIDIDAHPVRPTLVFQYIIAAAYRGISDNLK